MNEQLTRKIIVASGLAVVVGIGAMSVAMRPHAPDVVPVALTPPPPAIERPVAPEATAPLPEAPVALAPVAPVVQTPVTPEPKVASAAKRVAVKPARAAMAAAATANRADPAPAPAVTSTIPPAAVVGQQPEVAATLPVSDTEITANVKSEIAVDSVGMSGAIGVITTDGVVALTGSLSSQDAIDHIKGVVAKVKDVKSVDITAMSVSAT